ncbi:recombination protein NinB [Sphingobium sp. UBA5915]|uniref:recombination protein NinB n=1 Tax=Sphingobium sp. UBA5915 TaxID=1947530 RepID=UPI0025CD56C9|nr:recombination protein NinB [Sphingobium sp. UBA5915]
MPDGHTIILRSDYTRMQAHRLIEQAPQGAVLNIRAARRTVDQNALMWALLSEISRAKPEGRTLTPDVWKSLFLHALDHSQRFEMALDGKGMVPVGFRSSRLSKEQFSALIDTIHEYAARHGIVLSDELAA